MRFADNSPTLGLIDAYFQLDPDTGCQEHTVASNALGALATREAEDSEKRKLISQLAVRIGNLGLSQPKEPTASDEEVVAPPDEVTVEPQSPISLIK